MFDAAFAEFGRRMGMDGFALGRGGVAALDVERLGRLHFEEAEDGRVLLVYVWLPVRPQDEDAVGLRVLRLCDYREGHPMPLQAGVHRGGAVLLTRLAERDVTAAAMENAVRFLADVAGRIGS